MPTTVTEAGQITLPQAVLDSLKLKPGSEVDFRVEPDGRVVLLKVGSGARDSRFASLVGLAGPGPSTDEIMAMTRGEH
ncbi:MAG: AbrB/MazE/SpoVT family DNA-binding domain-containing protein [Bosea sp. (in: a-proteobacteria)]